MTSASIIVAAALTAASINLVPLTHAADSKPAAPTTAPATIHTVVKAADAAVQHVAADVADLRIQSTLQIAGQDAMTQGGMAKLVSMFADTEQQSIAKSSTYSQGYGDKLDAQIGSINKSWKQKYGHDFAIYKANDVLSASFASIKTQMPAPKSAGAESANVDLSSPSGASTLEIPLICQKNHEWRINVPRSLTAQRLRDNLLAELTDLNNQSAHWPTNETAAYQSVEDHVLMAVMDKPVPAAAHAQATAAPAKVVAKAAPPAAVAAKPAAATSTHHWWKFW